MPRTPGPSRRRAGLRLALAALAVLAVPATVSVAPAATGQPPLVAASVRTLPPSTPGGGTPGGGPFRVLQLNLCDSGEAPCYRLGNGSAVTEAAALIRATRPDLVTLNEICRADALTGLLPAVAAAWPADWTYAAFAPAGDRRTRGPYRCTDGDEFGLGVLGHAPGGRPDLRPAGALYPDAAAGRATQDTTSAEQRAWLCVSVPGAYRGCTTHLENASHPVAAAQCRYLTGTALPALPALPAGQPTVVGGDLNLPATGRPGAQDCVPAGWSRAGDGEVQHVLASTGAATARVLPMRHTDHPALLVTLTFG